jgi:predicted metal-dependent peptidase
MAIHCPNADRFSRFDRRFIGRGLYLEALASESVRVFVAVDTSGSVDFRPFFAAVAERYDPHEQSVCVYLTDGYGDFPAEPPDIPVLWVVTAGGKALDGFPFGEAVRLLES